MYKLHTFLLCISAFFFVNTNLHGSSLRKYERNFIYDSNANNNLIQDFIRHKQINYVYDELSQTSDHSNTYFLNHTQNEPASLSQDAPLKSFPLSQLTYDDQDHLHTSQTISHIYDTSGASLQIYLSSTRPGSGISDRLISRFGRTPIGRLLNVSMHTPLSGAGLKAPKSAIDDVIDGINHNADIATELARRAVKRGDVSGGARAFGSRAHSYFEKLNNRLNRRLRSKNSSLEVVSEEFRDVFKKVSGRRAAGSIGPDTIIRDSLDPSVNLIFDLKTHGGVLRYISERRQNEFLRRFGARAVEIFRKR